MASQIIDDYNSEEKVVAVISARNEFEILINRPIYFSTFQKIGENMLYSMIKMMIMIENCTVVEVRECEDEGERVRIGSVMHRLVLDRELLHVKNEYIKHKHIRGPDFWVARYLFQKDKEAGKLPEEAADEKEMAEYEQWIQHIKEQKDF